MIQSKEDYKRYLEADGVYASRSLYNILFNDIRKFIMLLRKTEYCHNCKKGIVGKLLTLLYKYRLRRQGRKLGFTIPINVFGPGLSLPHRGTIVVNPNAQVGSNCRIHVCVNIGASGGQDLAPRIGNNVYIGPGAKIFGNIEIADNIAIGANAVVNRSFTEPDITIGGIPAKKISNGGSSKAGWEPSSKWDS